MDIGSLKSKWDNIQSFQNKSGYKALRISSECICDLFIATDVDGYRCLLLFIPERIVIKIKGAEKDKLMLSYLDNKGIILIKLKDPDFIDLFNDLILSLYAKIKCISEPKEASQELIYTFYKWSDFFEDSFKHKLNNEQIQGLFGELFVLNEFLINSNPSNVNSFLESWKGPYDTTNDFVFDTKNIEVKTKIESKPFVKISSEFQLEKEFDKELELLVVSVKIDLINGESIYDLIIKIVKMVRENIGDLSILFHALNQKGLSIENLKEYNNHRFIVLKTELFDASKEDFPKLSKSNIENEITGLSYRLRVTQMDKFLIAEKKY